MRLHEKFSPGSLLMYTLTLTLEFPVIALRWMTAFIIAAIILALNGHPTIAAGTWSDFALIPTGWSLLALVWPGGLEFNDDTLYIIAVTTYITVWCTKMLAKACRGGLGLFLMRPLWGQYWREREYAADECAAVLGQADKLADFLEIHGLIHDHPIPFIWLTEHTHPPTELRIDRLRAHAHTPPPPPTPAPAETHNTLLRPE